MIQGSKVILRMFKESDLVCFVAGCIVASQKHNVTVRYAPVEAAGVCFCEASLEFRSPSKTSCGSNGNVVWLVL